MVGGGGAKAAHTKAGTAACVVSRQQDTKFSCKVHHARAVDLPTGRPLQLGQAWAAQLEVPRASESHALAARSASPRHKRLLGRPPAVQQPGGPAAHSSWEQAAHAWCTVQQSDGEAAWPARQTADHRPQHVKTQQHFTLNLNRQAQ